MEILLVWLAVVGSVIAAAVAFTWLAVRAVLWVLFFPLMLLKAIVGLVFGLLAGGLGLVAGLVFGAFGLLAGLVAGVFGLMVAAAVLAIPLLPLLLVALLIWIGVKGTQALASA